jgi:DNA-binding LytR/AlgR family response regulator
LKNKKLNQLIFLIKKDLGLYLSISFGIFLFVLFFQPFPIDKLNFNNRLLFIFGLAAIIYLFMVLVRIVFRWVNSDNDQIYHEPFIHSDVDDFIILVLNSVVLAFYLRYVGSVDISFYIMFKVVLICLIPTSVIRLYDKFKELRQRNESLIKEKELILKKIEKYEEDYQNKSFEFISENINEKFTILIADLIVIKSADNYVKILYKEDDNLKTRLIRNTLKSIEQQLNIFSNFIRCHRTAIINIYYIEKLNSRFNNYWLSIKGYNEKIPVSRQYLLKVKEIL